MSRLFVVSNRVALPGAVQAGGLAVALHGVLKERRGVWFGWSGEYGDGPSRVQIGDGIRFCLLDVPEDDFEGYYHGFANRALWPLLHYRVDLIHFDRGEYARYLAVNGYFADALARELRGNDEVWVHDYHFIPLAAALRARGLGQRIGFFLHIPLPSWDVLCMLPDHREIFSALAHYDLVGVQTQADADNLRRYFDAMGIDARECTIEAFPIGIDAAQVARDAVSASGCEAVGALRRSLEDRRLAIGVDRLDYSKGLPERFQAFGTYLDTHPDDVGRLTYLQIAPPSREDVPEYRDLREQLERFAGHINGRLARPDWTPIRYVNHCYPHHVLAGFYRTADVALVTPLRDGMNLVAKEYVAAQDPHDPGVLILSRFAGAAHQLEDALLVNPHDIDEMAEAIARARSMPRAEREARWSAMYNTLRHSGIGAWADGFLARLQSPAGPVREPAHGNHGAVPMRALGEGVAS
ncbi:alpha,alpha-trehalose-phosphate synthase (UDP-forming) [Pseudoxanthomonas sp. LARHCG66]